MYRTLLAFVLCLGLVGSSLAADAPAGSWKLTIRLNQQPVILLLAFSETNKKWTGDIVESTVQFNKEPKFDSLTVNGESVKFVMSVDKQPFLNFDGILAKDGKKISGSITLGSGQLELTDLRPSTLKKLSDPFEVMRESLAQTEEPQMVFEASQVVLGQAANKKMKADDVRSIVDRATKLATSYGPRFERVVSLRYAGILADQIGMEDIAVSQARKAERLLNDDDEVTVRMEVFESLVNSLTKAKKPEDAKKYEVQIQRLEMRDYQEYLKTNPPFKFEEFKTRKAKSDRVAVVEIFSSGEAVQASAFEYARDGLLKTYKPTDVIVLTYHMNINGGPDPLANKSTQERADFYQQTIGRGVLGYVNGKRAVQLQKDTNASSAKAVYESLREKAEEDLEKPNGAKLVLTVAAGEKEFTAKATVSDLEKAGEQTFLRFAVVEERVRYQAGNGVRYHHNVVRAMPGGKGIVLKQKTGDHTVKVNPDEIRDTITKYLDDVAKESEFPRAERPMALKNLKLVAFIQNDSNSEILAATQVDLAAK